MGKQYLDFSGRANVLYVYMEVIYPSHKKIIIGNSIPPGQVPLNFCFPIDVHKTFFYSVKSRMFALRLSYLFCTQREHYCYRYYEFMLFQMNAPIKKYLIKKFCWIYRVSFYFKSCTVDSRSCTVIESKVHVKSCTIHLKSLCEFKRRS